MALLVVMAALVLVLGLTSALILTSLTETRIAAAARDDELTLSAADAAASRALVDLRSADWNAVLGGAISSFSDGPPADTRMLADGTTISLDSETADIQCGRQASCTPGDITAPAEDRPWGSQNPRWRLFGHGPLSMLLPAGSPPPGIYLAVWVADDPTDSDGDPLTDGAGADNPGGGLLLVAARGYGPGGMRRTVELVVERAGTDVRILARHERHP